MVREIYDTELDDILKLYLNLHEDTVPEMTEHLKTTWETIMLLCKLNDAPFFTLFNAKTA